MKKTSLFILAIFLLLSVAQAQQVSPSRDTLPCGMRPPNHYYTYWYDTSAWYLYPDDHLISRNPNSNFAGFGYTSETYAALSHQYVYQQHVDYPLKIRGLWAMVKQYSPKRPVIDTARLPEYLSLYIRDTTKPTTPYQLGYIFTPIDSVRWDTAHPRMMCLSQTYDGRLRNLYCHIYEAYFKSPITVQGEFWIGGTTNSNSYVQPSHNPNDGYHEHYPTSYALVSSNHIGDYLIYNPYSHTCEGEHAHGGGPWQGYEHEMFYSPFGVVSEDMHQVLVLPDDTATGITIASAYYPDSSYQTITALHANCYLFDHWNDGVTDNPRTIFVTSDTMFTASFVPSTTHSVSVISNNSEAGNVMLLEKRRLHPMDLIPPGQDPNWVVVSGLDSTYCAGSPATFKAVVTNGNYVFCRWSNGCTDNPMTIEVTSDTIITAIFSYIASYNVTARSSDSTVGHVEGAGMYSQCDSVRLLAVPDDNMYLFRYWSDSSTNNPLMFVPDRDTALTAYFSPKRLCRLEAFSNDSTVGHVMGAGSYYELDTVLLTAVLDDSSYLFRYWSNGLTQNPLPVVVRCDTTLTAYFTPKAQYQVNALSNNPAMGSVSGSGTYFEGDTALLQASPNGDAYRFDHWSVDDTLNPLPIALTSDTTVTAFFVALQSIPQIIDSAATFRLLPNPAKESVRCVILGNDLCGGLVSLSDAAGREMFRCQLLPGQRSVELRLKDCPKGAYFVSLTTPRGTSTQKLVVE